MCEVDYD